MGERTRHFHNLTDLATDALRPDESMATSSPRRGARPRYVLPGTVEAGANVAMLQVSSYTTWRCIRAVLATGKAEMLLHMPFCLQGLVQRRNPQLCIYPEQSQRRMVPEFVWNSLTSEPEFDSHGQWAAQGTHLSIEHIEHGMA